MKIVCTSAAPAELGWYWLHEVGSPEPEAVFVGVGPGGLLVAGRLGEPDPRTVAGMPPGTRWCPIEPPELSADAARAAITAERARWAGWLRAAFVVMDRHVPADAIPAELAEARRELERAG